MTHFRAAVDAQRVAAQPKDRISGCRETCLEARAEKKVRLNFLSSDTMAMADNSVQPAITGA